MLLYVQLFHLVENHPVWKKQDMYVGNKQPLSNWEKWNIVKQNGISCNKTDMENLNLRLACFRIQLGS